MEQHDHRPAPRHPADRARWKRYLADERAEAAVYRELAARREGEEREILLALAAAEGRHEAHWLAKLGGDDDGMPRADLRTRVLAGLARRFGSIFVLALAQRAEARSPYSTDPHATAAMAADERIHGEVVADSPRAVAAASRERSAPRCSARTTDSCRTSRSCSASARRACPPPWCCSRASRGLLAGALSMGAGGVRLGPVAARTARGVGPDPTARDALGDLDIDANELALVYRARGMDQQDAAEQAALVIARVQAAERLQAPTDAIGTVEHDDEAIGTGLSAAISSFLFFASGALIPVLPYLFGMSGLPGDRHRDRAREHRAAAHRRHRRTALGRLAAPARPAPARDRPRRGRRDVPSRPRVRHHDRLRRSAATADLADAEAPERVVEQVTRVLGPVWALVLSHSESVDSGMLDTSVESFDRHFAVNARAAWLLIRSGRRPAARGRRAHRRAHERPRRRQHAPTARARARSTAS